MAKETLLVDHGKRMMDSGHRRRSEISSVALKTYEIRKFDRDYKVGDFLMLAEFDRQTRQYSGQKVHAKIVSMTAPGSYDMPADVGVLGIEIVAPAPDSLR